MGLPPGEVRQLSPPSVDRMLVSTHGLPLTFFLDRLGSASGEIVLIGIEPADLSFGEGLSSAVGGAVDRLTEALTSAPGGVGSIPLLECGPSAPDG
jgi:hydrogenase 3 maturation protease